MSLIKKRVVNAPIDIGDLEKPMWYVSRGYNKFDKKDKRTTSVCHREEGMSLRIMGARQEVTANHLCEELNKGRAHLELRWDKFFCTNCEDMSKVEGVDAAAAEQIVQLQQKLDNLKRNLGVKKKKTLFKTTTEVPNQSEEEGTFL